MPSHPQLVRDLHMPQVKGRVIDDVHDAPADRELTAPHLPQISQVRFGQRGQDLPRLQAGTLQETDQLRAVFNLCEELGIAVAGGWPAAYYLADPKTLCAGDVGRQDSERIRGVFLCRARTSPGLTRRSRDSRGQATSARSVIRPSSAR